MSDVFWMIFGAIVVLSIGVTWFTQIPGVQP
jgi:hypothetical protein